MNPSARSNVRRLAIARAISVTGGAAAFMALMFEVYRRTNDPMWLSWALLLTWGTSGLVGPFAGHLGDRLDRRKVMIVSDLLGTVAFGAMAFAHDPGLLLLFGALAAIVETPYWSSSAAAIPNLVASEDDISWANGLVSVGRNLGITVGPAIGGVLVSTVGGGWVFGINAVSFAISAAITVTVHGRFREERADAHEDEHRGAAAGFRFIFGDRVLRTMTLAWVVLVLGLGMALVGDVPLARHFHTGSLGYGIMISSWGLGSVVASWLGRYLRARTEPLALVLGTVGIAVTMGGIALAPVFWVVPVAIFLNGVADGYTIVGEQGIRQRRTPDAVRSRAQAAAEAIVQVALAVGYLVAAPVIRAVGPQGLYGIGGVTGGFAVLVLLRCYRQARDEAAPPARGNDTAIEAEGTMR